MGEIKSGCYNGTRTTMMACDATDKPKTTTAGAERADNWRYVKPDLLRESLPETVPGSGCLKYA